MKKLVFLSIFVVLVIAFSPAFAQDAGGYSYLYENSPENPQPRAAEIPFDPSGKVKDSFYFMKDDGEFSDEEKDQEAAYIFQTCLTNKIRRQYFDCGCIAGAFRLERDSPDLVPQSHIVNKVYNDPNTKCVNTTGIAGTTYNKCLHFSKTFRHRKTEEENADYCQCVANKTVANFQEKPKLNLRHMEKMKVAANLECYREEDKSIF